jgi:YebC/PmpR family DNA-binding regulatory protein
MAGHSKWAKTKRMKAVVDAKRGKVFSRLSREISLVAKAGGGDADMNPRLRTLLLKARTENMPAENIERAIKKGTGELPGVSYEQVVYEGYAPGGVAVIVEVTTDNKNRAAAEVRSIFSKYGGNLAGAGAVSFQFQHLGQFLISREKTSEEQLMEIALEFGADDVKSSLEGYEILCPIPAYETVSQALESRGILPDSAEIAYIPTATVPVTDLATAKSIAKLLEALEESEDVQNVFSNEEMDEALSEAVHA